jgi:hypothetical protein
MAVIYRNAGSWGSGKGARLTSLEVDENFYDHELRIADMEANPPSAVSIASIDVTGNQMTINLTDSSRLGPFTIPTSQWTWKGEWSASTLYGKFDVLSNEGSIYLVLVAHTSESTFAPDAENEDGFYYALLIEVPSQPYDIGLYYGDVIPNDGRIILQHIATRDFVIGPDFGVSSAFLTDQVTEGDLVLDVYRNETMLGTVTFEIGENIESSGDGQFGVFAQLSPAGDMEFSRLDRLTFRAPTSAYNDPAGLSLTIAARVAPLIASP